MPLGYVYKIYNTSDLDKVYIGSTKKQLIKRLQDHKRAAKNNPNKKNKWFEYLRQHSYENFRIVMLDSVDYQHKSQLRELEDRYIRQLKPELNTNNVIRTEEEKQEYSKQHSKQYKQTEKWKEYIKQYNKQYREQHKEQVSAKEKDQEEEQEEKKEYKPPILRAMFRNRVETN